MTTKLMNQTKVRASRLSPQPGSKAWLDSVQARLRAKYGDGAKLKTISAKLGTDTADPFLFTARITKAVLDRDGEVLLPGGMDASEFDASGAVFWNHDYNSPVAAPVGKMQKNADEIIAKARFMKRVEGDNGAFLPDYARSFGTAMAEAGRSAGVSVGFVGIKDRNPTKKDREEFGEGVTRVFTQWKLLEWSIAPVQANQDAYVTALGKSIDPVCCKSLFGYTPRIVEEEPEKKPELVVSLTGAKGMLDLRRAVRAELKRQREERAKNRREAEARRKVQIELLPKLAVAKARGELYVGQYGR